MNDKPASNQEPVWNNELLTIKEVAAYLRLSRVTVWRWCKQGLMPARQVGHHWRIHREDLQRLLDTGPAPLPASGPILSDPAGVKV